MDTHTSNQSYMHAYIHTHTHRHREKKYMDMNTVTARRIHLLPLSIARVQELRVMVEEEEPGGLCRQGQRAHNSILSVEVHKPPYIRSITPHYIYRQGRAGRQAHISVDHTINCSWSVGQS